MNKLAFAVAVAASATLLWVGSANAAGQGITGKKLLLKSKSGKEKLVLLSKDALLSAGANGSPADPRCPPGSGWGAAVVLDDGVNTAVLNIPCAVDMLAEIPNFRDVWITNRAGTAYKYKRNDSYPYTFPAPKVAKVNPALLKIVSRTLGGLPVPTGVATINVKVRVGLDQYCMAFTGTGNGTKFTAKDAAAVACPNAQPGCTGEYVSGACWHLGEPGESCDDTCTALEQSCDPAR
jgi:hypothetical protein